MRSSLRLYVVALATFMLLTSSLAGPSSGPSAGAAAVVPHVLFGSNATGGKTAVERIESQIGRRLAAVRVYMNWDSTFPNTYTDWLKSTGHAIYLSVKSRRSNGTIVKWANIAAATPGTPLYGDMVRWAGGLKSFGDHIYFIFNHEPEAKSSDPMGTASEFIAAWRKIVNVFRNQGATNVDFVWTMTDYAFEATDGRAAGNWYPGDSYVDQIGSDVYNWYQCRWDNKEAWKALATKLEPMRLFGLAHPSEDLVLPEWGSVEDWATGGRKRSWFDAAATLFQQSGWEQFRAVLYFNSADQSYSKCVWRYDTTSSALNGFTAMGGIAWFRKFE